MEICLLSFCRTLFTICNIQWIVVYKYKILLGRAWWAALAWSKDEVSAINKNKLFYSSLQHCFYLKGFNLNFSFLSPRLKLKAVYMYAAGFYVYSIFDLLFWETRRKDFGVSMSHHVATVVLIVMSYICRFVHECNCPSIRNDTQHCQVLMLLLFLNRLSRAGSVILAIHDASDIFLEIGKMAKYSSCEWLAVVAFLLFVASWILLRLFQFACGATLLD